MFSVYSTSKVDSPKWYMMDVLCLQYQQSGQSQVVHGECSLFAVPAVWTIPSGTWWMFSVYSTSKVDNPKWYMMVDCSLFTVPAKWTIPSGTWWMFSVYSTSKVDSPKWYMVDVKYKAPLDRFVSLSELKQLHQEHAGNGGPLRNMALFTRARLSVQPVSQGWQ